VIGIGFLAGAADSIQQQDFVSGVDDRMNRFAHHGGAARPNRGANFAESYKNVSN
jgi:hypothetical protein